MNTLNNNSPSTKIPNACIFARDSENNKTKNVFDNLINIFQELGIKNGDKLCLKHLEFQWILEQYTFEDHLSDFLEDNGFELYDNLYDFSYLIFLLSHNEALLLDIKTGRMNIAVSYNWNIPVWIVLARKIESKIDTLVSDTNNQVSMITHPYASRMK